MKKGEKRKQELLQIAYRMFISRGYENTSVDEIIEEAGIAKGTFYYYFETKEQLLEEVIGMMIDRETEAAAQILAAEIPVSQKIAGIISSLRPPENIVMHEKIRKKIVEAAIPLLSRVVEEGIAQGVFSCDCIPERVRMLLVISSVTFDDGRFTARDTAVFIDMAEKLLGAAPGTLGFIRDLIR